MKLLIFVNKFDEDDDLLGFFTGWVNGLSQNFEKISIIAQFVGRHPRLDNVEVFSLGKERRKSRLARLLTFYKYSWRLRKNYDAAFIFMAPAWAIISWPVLKLAGKKMALWYAVWKDSFKLRLATLLSDKVISSVPRAFPFKTGKLALVGQGVDVNYFRPNKSVPNQRNRILFLGRISPVKKIEVLFGALKHLRTTFPDAYSKVSVNIIGGPTSEKDEIYLEQLRKLSNDIKEKINWFPGVNVPHSEILDYYQEAGIFVNLTPTGSFDKTMLEAMACGDLLLASNAALANFFSEEQKQLFLFKQNDPKDLSEKLAHLLSLGPEKADRFRMELRDVIVKNHSQENLVNNLTKLFKSL